jgi:uncharacterized protein (TIGR02145 family)
MIFLKKIPFLILLFSLSFGCSDDSQTNESKKYSAKEIYTLIVNKTVTIYTEKGLGSGFFIDSNIICTNYHVIEGVNQAFVILNNSPTKYEITGFLAVDKVNDLVLLQTNYKNNNYLELDDKTPPPGEKVFALGSPEGLAKTISEGIISGIRSFPEKKLLQITAPISHGSSGCPIVNEEAKLIGVAVGALEQGNDLNFCIPINYLKTLMDFKETFPTALRNLNNVNQNQKSDNESNGYIDKEKPGQVTSKPNNEASANLVWMEQNLNVDHFRNGDLIPEAKSNEEWINADNEEKPAWCYKDNNPSDGEKNGKLYNWYAVSDPRGLAPKGWHIPSDKECKMDKKINNADGAYKITVGFTGSTGGFRKPDGRFHGMWEHGNWWTITRDNQFNTACSRRIRYNGIDMIWSHEFKGSGLSVRCVKD